ncbi:MAG: polyribonucleotide nucleotidyltransferase [Candidatus Saccharimonadales bacterium]|nr:polyribonucleotide nucleotidyltransferase [Candidatus Saccharimonadales bacterium]
MGSTIHPFGGEVVSVETEFCGRKLTMETGRLAFQADGAVLVRYGESVVLGVAGLSKEPLDGFDYFPLMIDYEEKMYAAGKISGSRFIKREGRPSEEATLTSRLIDRPIRPLFPDGFRNEVQGIAMVLSLDPEIKTDTIAMLAVSAAIKMTGAPFAGPIGGVRIGLVDNKLTPYPTTSEMAKSDLDLTVAGTADAIMMVEAGANEVDEKTMVEALELAHKEIQPAIKLQNELMKKLGVEEKEFTTDQIDEEIVKEVDAFLKDKLGKNVRNKNMKIRKDKLSAIKEEMIEKLVGDDEEKDAKAYKEAFSKAEKKDVRRGILEEKVRPDLRGPEDIRPLSSEVGVLPRTHGSSIFTRGATQALNITTLAPLSYAQVVDTMDSDMEKFFFHHYNMPGFTVGEVRRPRSPGRREIGHGALVERAIRPVLPNTEDFPYTVRAVSELMSSNGSTSMASVCSSTLSLMDAGVPISKPVSGIAMGLMSDGKEFVVLSDIQGTEDFAGDMDFKVAGTEDGITALQMDIKVDGLSSELLAKALDQAKKGRIHILESMTATIPEPRDDLSPYAPRIEKIMVDPDKIRDIIGKGGETINKIIDETGAEIDIRDEGLVVVSSVDGESIKKALQWIEDLTAEPEVGKVYTGTVVKVMEFGAFVQIMPGKDGLVHISELEEGRVEKVTDVVNEGDTVTVKLVAIDDQGRLNLSMRAVNRDKQK